MRRSIADLIEEIGRLPANWHEAGTVEMSVLRAIARHAEAIGPIEHSVETGSGKTTLLFSHLAASHAVFAVDAGRSISQVRESPLFNSATTTFVEGPTQRTIARHEFQHLHQIVLIDGPHGYPFPDLEYFYLYPTIAVGGLLLIDDLKIPSVGRMFDILKADAMYRLLEVVDGNTGFLQRTDAPLVHPESDSWWLQGFNKPYYDHLLGVTPAPAAVPPLAPAPGAAPDRAGRASFIDKIWRTS
jgi:hypothetical protein